jgi:hypothetical protein
MSNDAAVAEREPTHALRVSDLVERLPPFFTISIAAKRFVGKTVLVTELIGDLLTMRRVDLVFIMTGSYGLNDDYKGIVPPGHIMAFRQDVLENIFARQKATDPEKRLHVFVVLDDCLTNKDAVRNEYIESLYSLGRHMSVSIAILSQYTRRLLSPLIKQNSDMILWAKLSRANLAVMFDESTNIDRKDFIRVAEQLSGRGRAFMVLDRFIDSTEPTDFLTVVRATWPPKYAPPKKTAA